MKLPVPLLLYAVSLGLAGSAGWTVYKMLPLSKKEAREGATNKGVKDATDRVSLGRGQGPLSADWNYGRRTADWWSQIKAVNLIGKLPPPPPPAAGTTETKEPEVVADVRPLDQIIELVSLVYDSKDLGKGEFSHVIVRYRPEANVQPPEWYMRETAVAGARSGGAAPGDVAAAAARPGGNPRGPQGKPAPGSPGAGRGPGSSMPTSMVGREFLQKVWIQGDGDPRREPTLWPPFQDIRLVRVADDAASAFFVRAVPPPKAGQPAVEPKEEQLMKAAMGLSQDVLREVNRLNGKAGAEGAATKDVPVASANAWVDNQETTISGKVVNVGRKDEESFRQNADEFWEKVHLDTYVSRVGSTRGLQVRNIDPKIATKFGVQQGDVLLEVNGRPVQTQAQAVQFGKNEYKKGVRTFVMKWLTAGGQIVEKIIQVPDR